MAMKKLSVGSSKRRTTSTTTSVQRNTFLVSGNDVNQLKVYHSQHVSFGTLSSILDKLLFFLLLTWLLTYCTALTNIGYVHQNFLSVCIWFSIRVVYCPESPFVTKLKCVTLHESFGRPLAENNESSITRKLIPKRSVRIRIKWNILYIFQIRSDSLQLIRFIAPEDFCCVQKMKCQICQNDNDVLKSSLLKYLEPYQVCALLFW